MRKKSLSSRIAIVFAILIAVVTFILSFVAIRAAKTQLIAREKDAMEEQAETMAQEIEVKLTSNLDNLKTFARRSEFLDPEVSFEDRAVLCSDEADKGIYYTVLYVDTQGNTLLPKFHINLNLFETHDEAFMQAVETGEACYKNTVTLNGTTLMVSNAVPVLDQAGKVDAVIVGTVLITDFGSLLGDDVEAFIVDPNGAFIGHTLAAQFAKDESDEYYMDESGALVTEGDGVNISVNPITYQEVDPSYVGLASLISNMLESESGFADYVSRETGAPQYVAYATVPSTGWRVAYLENQSVITNVENRMINVQLAVAALMTLAGAIITLFIARFMMKPLSTAADELNSIIEGIQAGEGDLTVRIPVKTNDEVGNIITSINKYTEELQHVTLKIKEGTVSLNESVSNVMAAIEASNDQATDNSAIMQELSASMAEIEGTTAGIKAHIEEMYEEIDNINNEAEDGKKFANDMNERAENLKDSSEASQANTRKMIDEITTTLRQSIENSKNVDKINDLTNDILSIASQTNLLALNASIEAARAGEAGKGFAVVADEIRQLADNSKQTAGSIQEVSNMVYQAVNDLVKDANQLLEYMNTDISADYGSMVETGEAYVGDAGQLDAIMTAFQKKTDLIKESITAVLELITGTSNAITESAGGIQHAADNTVELVTSISQIDDEMNNNINVTSNLKNEIEKFKNV